MPLRKLPVARKDPVRRATRPVGAVLGKYGNRRASYAGKTYHSQLERDDAVWLHQLQRDGTISNLAEQVRYRIFVEGAHICDSIVDFAFDCNGTRVWYETKGLVTDAYRIKRKLLEAVVRPGEAYVVNAKALMEFIRTSGSA